MAERHRWRRERGRPRRHAGGALVNAPISPAEVLGQRPPELLVAVIALGGNVGAVVPALMPPVRNLRATDDSEITSDTQQARTTAIPDHGGPEQDD